MLLLFSWSAGCVASHHSSCCSDPGFPVASFCSHQLIRATRVLQRVIPSLSWFLVQLSLLLGTLISILLIEPSACSWLCSFTSSGRSGLQLPMLFLPAVGTALSCSLLPLSPFVFLDALGVDDQGHHLLDRLRVTEDTLLWSIGISFALTSLASCSLEAPPAIAVTASVAFTPCPLPTRTRHSSLTTYLFMTKSCLRPRLTL